MGDCVIVLTTHKTAACKQIGFVRAGAGQGGEPPWQSRWTREAGQWASGQLPIAADFPANLVLPGNNSLADDVAGHDVIDARSVDGRVDALRGGRVIAE